MELSRKNIGQAIYDAFKAGVTWKAHNDALSIREVNKAAQCATDIEMEKLEYVSRMRAIRTPNCRFCGSNKWVAVWRDNAPEQTICMECCGSKEHDRGDGEWGHEFDRGTQLSVSSCIHCGMERDHDANPTDGPVI